MIKCGNFRPAKGRCILCLLALLFAFVGLAVILGGNGGIPIPRTAGDIFALLSGIFWAVVSMGLLKAPAIPARVQVFGFFLGALVLSLITLGVMQGQGGCPFQYLGTQA